MRKIHLLMHTSLDGFVAGPNGEFDWVRVDDELMEIALELTDNADTVLYGRVTFQMMENYWPTAGDKPNASRHDIEHSKWYNSVEKVVLSKTMKKAITKNTRFIGDNILDEINQLKRKPGKNILIIGSPSFVHLLMKQNLIDDYWLFVNPIVLGKGIPLFSGIKDKFQLKLLRSKEYSIGVIALHYERKSVN